MPGSIFTFPLLRKQFLSKQMIQVHIPLHEDFHLLRCICDAWEFLDEKPIFIYDCAGTYGCRFCGLYL